MVDGYKGYNKVPEAQRCCCWAHIRLYWLRAIPKGYEKDYTHPAVQGFNNQGSKNSPIIVINKSIL